MHPPVQRDRETTFALDPRGREARVGLIGDSGYGVEVGLGAVVVRDRAVVVGPLEAVLPDVAQTIDRELLTQERDRPAAHDGDETGTARDGGERVAGGGQRDRVVGLVDDLRQRPVEVGQDGEARGITVRERRDQVHAGIRRR